MRIENNVLLEDVPGTVLADILHLDLTAIDLEASHQWEYWEEEDFDLIWASPPCRDFSNAYRAPRSVADREGIEHIPDMNILIKCLEIIDYFKPKYHVIENVAGAPKFFNPIIGAPPRQIVGPFFLWGIFPRLIMEYDWTHSKYEGEKWSSDPLRANYRGKVPQEISNQLLRSVIGQKQITDWCK